MLAFDPSSALGYLDQAVGDGTGGLARRHLARAETAAAAPADLAALLALQGDDFGFGAGAGHAATTLDVAPALNCAT